MVRKADSPNPSVVRVTFELPESVWASQVYLTGDFVKDSTQKTPMQQGRDGSWRVTVDLPAGNRYKYRYLIDKNWYTDWNPELSDANLTDPTYSVLDLAPHTV
jgi:1,4-alpha-glucan branching enzyme